MITQVAAQLSTPCIIPCLDAFIASKRLHSSSLAFALTTAASRCAFRPPGYGFALSARVQRTESDVQYRNNEYDSLLHSNPSLPSSLQLRRSRDSFPSRPAYHIEEQYRANERNVNKEASSKWRRKYHLLFTMLIGVAMFCIRSRLRENMSQGREEREMREFEEKTHFEGLRATVADDFRTIVSRTRLTLCARR